MMTGAGFMMRRQTPRAMTLTFPPLSGSSGSRRRPALLGSLTVAAASLLVSVGPLPPSVLPPAAAQERVPASRVRAINFARTYAVRINGGLAVYRPAQCMFATAATTNPCLVSDDENGVVFRFLGGPPAWEAKDLPATRETEIRVSPDGRSLEEVIYNGPPR